MVTAVEAPGGPDPDRAGFTIALEAARDTVIRVSHLVPARSPDSRPDLTGHIGAAILFRPLPAHRTRISACIVKRGISRYHTWNHDGRPLASIPITARTLSVHPPIPPIAPAPAESRTLSRRGRWTQASQLMATDAYRTWQAQEIADALGITGRKPFNSLSTQLGYWARGGHLTRTVPSTYKITLPAALTAAESP
ncbi:hypothetical protein AB0D11_44710 [Streptomyces monashensis]